MSVKIKTQYNKAEFKNDTEVNTLPSMTIPDQAMSIPEMIKRYASGLPLGGARVPMYEENPEQDILGGRSFASFDLSEQNDIVRNAKAEYYETINRLQNNKPQEVNPNPFENNETNTNNNKQTEGL